MRLYRGHVPSSALGKVLLGLDAAARALADPRQARMVGVVGEATGQRALRRMHSRMHRHPVGRAVLNDRPVLSAETLAEQLHGLPPESFGGAYAAFLEHNAFDPDERSAVQFIDDADLAYVMTRYRQVHDLWHVLYGLPPSLLGEVALKWLESAQTGLPMATMAAAAGGLRLKPAERALVTRHVLPWAAAHSRSAVDLMSVYYEREFARPLDELRRELGVDMLPEDLFRKTSRGSASGSGSSTHSTGSGSGTAADG